MKAMFQHRHVLFNSLPLKIQISWPLYLCKAHIHHEHLLAQKVLNYSNALPDVGMFVKLVIILSENMRSRPSGQLSQTQFSSWSLLGWSWLSG